jgi:hypothetical protein
MHKKEPFREAFKPVPGMLRVSGLKDDPRFKGGVVMPTRVEGFIIRPDPCRFVVRIILWLAVLAVAIPGIEAHGFAVVFVLAVILDAVFAIPKFFFEKTAILPEGIERTVLFMEEFFPWENIHEVAQDALGISFRSKRPWGMWMDDYNCIVSWIYYSHGSIERIVEIFPELKEKRRAVVSRKFERDELIDISKSVAG